MAAGIAAVSVTASARAKDRPTWRSSFVWIAAALWLPHLAALAFDQRVRRFAEDIWFWPGAFPGALVLDDMYTPMFGAFTLLHLLIWTSLSRRNKWLGIAGAFLCSALAMGLIQTLMGI